MDRVRASAVDTSKRLEVKAGFSFNDSDDEALVTLGHRASDDESDEDDNSEDSDREETTGIASSMA